MAHSWFAPLRLKPSRRVKGPILAAVVLCLLAAGSVAPASAQGFGWLGRFFGGGNRAPEGPYGDPRDPGYGDDYYAPRHRAPHRKKSIDAQDTTKDTASKPKAPAKTATIFVDVFGDTFGQLLANGLDDALSDKSDVGVVHAGRGSSGLANSAYYDWPKTIDDLVARQDRSRRAAGAAPGQDKKTQDKPAQDKPGQDKLAQDKPAQDKLTQDKPAQDKRTQDKQTQDKQTQDELAQDEQVQDEQAHEGTGDKTARDGKRGDKPNRIDVAVMMIGSNDRQPIVQDGKRLDPGSDEWTAVYRRRVMAVAEAFQRKKIPLVWVGLPIVKDDDVADDMAALNDVYRDAAAKTGAAFIDTWEAFSDDNGNFAAYGPDVNGQTVRLRTADGIYFTRAGARKLAHFVEAQVRRDLDGKAPIPELPTAASPADPKDKKPGQPAVARIKPDAGPIKTLNELATAKDGRLIDVTQKDERADDPVVGNALVKGKPDAAPTGRADNFRWPADGKGAAPQ